MSTDGQSAAGPSRAAAVPAGVWRAAGALLIGTAGGALFALIEAPLAWMLGAMTAATLAALSGQTLAIPAWLRTAMIAVIGVMLGAAFSPALAAALPRWAGAIGLLVLFCWVLGALNYVYFRRVAGYDRTTAYFAAAPGGIVEMTLQAEKAGADPRIVSLLHATRILMVVATVPLYFRWVEGLDVPVLPSSPGDAGAFTMAEGGLLLACGIIGYPLGRLARLPLAALTGPMIASAAAHLGGLSHIGPPPLLIAAAQVVLGVGIGCRFTGFSLADMRLVMLRGAGASLIMIAVAVLTSLAAAPLFGLPFQSLLLAFVPGGLAEMALIALSLGVDTAFVSTLHILRIVLVILAAHYVYRWLLRRWNSS